jgi:hypothetical protein
LSPPRGAAFAISAQFQALSPSSNSAHPRTEARAPPPHGRGCESGPRGGGSPCSAPPSRPRSLSASPSLESGSAARNAGASPLKPSLRGRRPEPRPAPHSESSGRSLWTQTSARWRLSRARASADHRCPRLWCDRGRGLQHRQRSSAAPSARRPPGRPSARSCGTASP